jgi:hypothetical protein
MSPFGTTSQTPSSFHEQISAPLWLALDPDSREVSSWM